MEKQGFGAHENNEKTGRLRENLTWIPLILMMVFFAGTWSFPWFYHITEIYNSLIIFAALSLLFLIRIDWLKRLKEKDVCLYVTLAAILIAVVNLFIIGSNKGCILILTDFLLLLYMAPHLKLSGLQMRVLEIFFFLMYLSWFIYDRAFSYNSNTGATYTVFTLFAALILLKRFQEKREIAGLLIVMALLRTGTLVMWHLARGAFMALFFFAVFGSLLFVISYVKLSQTGFNAQMPFFYKNIFSGREQIWAEVWDMLKQHLLTGIGSGYKLKSFFEYNIHNAMYDILAVHGLIVFLLSAFMIIARLASMRGLIRRNSDTLIASAAIFAIFFESFIDMDLMWADYSPVILSLFLEVFKVEEKRV